MRVDDPPPGTECQVDFGRLGLVPEGTGGQRLCHALVVTACWSRHQFVWPRFSQSIESVIEGFEAAWRFFDAVFPVVIPDSMKAIVETADNLAPRINDTFMEYAQSRGFRVDAARIRTPTDKPRVERAINFFAGESFVDLDDVRRRAVIWCMETAGMRIVARCPASSRRGRSDMMKALVADVAPRPEPGQSSDSSSDLSQRLEFAWLGVPG